MFRVTALAGLAVVAGLAASAPASAQVGGSYRASCTNVDQRGPILRAMCRDVSGRLSPTQIDVRNCSGGVANINGRLACGNGGGGGGRGGYDRRDRSDDGYRDRDRSERRRGYDDGYRPRY